MPAERHSSGLDSIEAYAIWKKCYSDVGDQKPTWVRLIYSTEQQQTGENRKTGRLKSENEYAQNIGKQSGESRESVQEKKR